LARQRYYERVYDLAFEICEVLKLYRLLSDGSRARAPVEGVKTVYLAATTSDQEPTRDRLRRELAERGHRVLPVEPLPVLAGELEAGVRRHLEQVDLAIHLVGDRFGLVPEGSELSVVAIQNEVASAYSRETGLERLIWMPREVSPKDDRQARFIERLMNEPEAHWGGEVILGTIEDLKDALEEKWKPVSGEAATAPVDESRGERPPRLYLVCDQRDEQAVEPIEDYLFERGIEVSLPGFDVEEARVQEVHQQNLEDCDAVLVYYGVAGKSWVDIKLRELIKARGYRGGRTIAVQAVYVAPPSDRRKERFRTLSAEVIRQEGERFDPGLLEGVVANLQQLRAQGR